MMRIGGDCARMLVLMFHGFVTFTGYLFRRVSVLFSSLFSCGGLGFFCFFCGDFSLWVGDVFVWLYFLDEMLFWKTFTFMKCYLYIWVSPLIF